MTMLNAFVTPDAAYIAVDTQTSQDTIGGPPVRFDDGRLAEVSKLFPFVASNVVFAGRGAVAFLAFLASAQMMAPGLSFDAVADQIPAAMKQATAALSGQVPSTAQEVVLVGWSAKRSRMYGVGYFMPLQGDVTRTEIGGDTGDSLVAPWAADWGAYDEPDSAAAMMALARRQREMTQNLETHPSVGGRVLMAKVTKDTLDVRTLGNL